MYCLADVLLVIILHLIVLNHSVAVPTRRLNICRLRREFGTLAVSELRAVRGFSCWFLSFSCSRCRGPAGWTWSRMSTGAYECEKKSPCCSRKGCSLRKYYTMISASWEKRGRRSSLEGEQSPCVPFKEFKLKLVLWTEVLLLISRYLTWMPY